METTQPSIVYVNPRRGAHKGLLSAVRNKPYRNASFHPSVEAMKKAFEPGSQIQHRQTQLKLETREELWPQFGFIFAGKQLLEKPEDGEADLIKAIAFLHQTVIQRTRLIVHMADLETAQSLYDEWDSDPNQAPFIPGKTEVGDDLKIDFRPLNDDSTVFHVVEEMVKPSS